MGFCLRTPYFRQQSATEIATEMLAEWLGHAVESTPLAQCCRGSLQGKSSIYLVGTVMRGWGRNGDCINLAVTTIYQRFLSASTHFCIRGSLPGVGTVWNTYILRSVSE